VGAGAVGEELVGGVVLPDRVARVGGAVAYGVVGEGLVRLPVVIGQDQTIKRIVAVLD